MAMMYWICEYSFLPISCQPSFWERLLGERPYVIHTEVFIQADTIDEAEDKFHVYYSGKHPGRKLITFNVMETVV